MFHEPNIYIYMNIFYKYYQSILNPYCKLMLKYILIVQHKSNFGNIYIVYPFKSIPYTFDVNNIYFDMISFKDIFYTLYSTRARH